MSTNLAIQIYKNANSQKAPTINLPTNLPPQDLINPNLIKVAKSLFEENGVLIINNLLSQDLITNVHQSFVECYQSYFEDKEYDNVLEVGNRRKMLTLDFKEPFNNSELYGNPFAMYLMRGLLGSGFVLGSFGAVIALPGAEHQHIHRDHPSLFEEEDLNLQLPSFAITFVIPLIDLTPETGSTRVWKGSHKVSHSQDFEMKDSFIPFVSTGSCYLMDYQLLHGGTPNVSNLVRPILYLTYYRSWFQEAVNYDKQSRLSITKKQYQAIPEKYKFLFERVRESIKVGNSLELIVDDSKYPKKFTELTSDEQVQKLGKLAIQALGNYGFQKAQVQLISHGENTVFSVSTPDSASEQQGNSSYLSNRFILRIHRANYLSVNAIESELYWLQSLHHQAKLSVPTPIPTLEGKVLTLVNAPEISESRVCSLTRWVNGRSLMGEDSSGKLQLLDLELIGQLMGKLHHYAANWSIPENFIRPSWNWNGLFGDRAGYSDNGAVVWKLTPQPYRGLFQEISEQVQAVMASLGEDKEQFGLIHGDFWLGNLLKLNHEICLIDFADCGFGYWGYELARFLSDFSTDQNFPLYLDRLLSGYTQIRPFPEEQLPYINLFIIAQQVTLTLWRVNRSQDHPSFRSFLEEELQETAEAVKTFLAHSS